MTPTPSTLKSRLPRTWSPFFARHGAFTPAQLAAIPPLLDGHNVMLCAPTASGKTEAALAPLIERHLPPTRNTKHAARNTQHATRNKQHV
ncbi:MAG: DEAD/DEAH box helicase, partial [Caldilinea sp.]